MKIRVQEHDFNISEEISELCSERIDVGAVVTFTGLVRDFHEDKSIHKLTLEHFPGMAEKQLTTICETAHNRWSLQGCTVIHRYGPLTPGQQIVLVITMSAHRGDAFHAAEFIMDWLKTDAPFWKKEETAEGSHWVEAKDTDNEKCKEWLHKSP